MGKGSITYIGAWLDEKTMNAAAKWMVEASGIHPLSIDLPKGVDLYVRSRIGTDGEQKTVWILVNFGKDVATVSLPEPDDGCFGERTRGRSEAGAIWRRSVEQGIDIR